MRIQVFNPKDENEIALINKLQDHFIIKANSADPLPEFKWDLQSLKALTVQYEKDSAQYSSWKGMMGPRGKVDEKTVILPRPRRGGFSRNGTPRI